MANLMTDKYLDNNKRLVMHFYWVQTCRQKPLWIEGLSRY